MWGNFWPLFNIFITVLCAKKSFSSLGIMWTIRDMSLEINEEV